MDTFKTTLVAIKLVMEEMGFESLDSDICPPPSSTPLPRLWARLSHARSEAADLQMVVQFPELLQEQYRPYLRSALGVQPA